jgi:hypothetical protein
MGEQIASNFAQVPENTPAVRTDPTGDVDMSLIDYMLSLTPTGRIEANYRAKTLARELRRAARKVYGPAVDSIAPLE